MITLRIDDTALTSCWMPDMRTIVLKTNERVHGWHMPAHLVVAHEIGHAMCWRDSDAGQSECEAGYRWLMELEAWTWALRHNPGLAKHHGVIIAALNSYDMGVQHLALYDAFRQKLCELGS